MVKEKITVPLKCEDNQLYSFKHAFLSYNPCLINLLGPNLMYRLGVCLVPNLVPNNLCHPRLTMVNYITVLLFSNRFGTPRSDLSETPPSNSDLVLSLDGSVSRNPITECSCVGFAVVSPHATLVSSSIPRHYSAQAAVTIYTDLRYAFAVVHDFGALWMQIQSLQVPVF